MAKIELELRKRGELEAVQIREEFEARGSALEASIRLEFEQRGEQIMRELRRELEERGRMLQIEGEDTCTDMISMACEVKEIFYFFN